MKSLKFLDQLKNEQELKNDVAICKLLGWSSGQISQYRSGKRIMDNEACLALALELKIDPLLVIMAADIDRAERSGQHSLWEVFSRRATQTASVALFGAVTLFVTPTPSEAAPVLQSKTAIFILC